MPACYTLPRMSNELSEYGPVQRANDVLAGGVFLWLCAMSGKRIWVEGEPDEWPWFSLASFAGLLAADFISGFVPRHEDTKTAALV